MKSTPDVGSRSSPPIVASGVFLSMAANDHYSGLPRLSFPGRPRRGLRTRIGRGKMRGHRPWGCVAGMAFQYSRRVAFAETDLAGIVHFSTFFRYMEEAEHALWRAAGLPVFQTMNNAGWPRVS